MASLNVLICISMHKMKILKKLRKALRKSNGALYYSSGMLLVTNWEHGGRGAGKPCIIVFAEDLWVNPSSVEVISPKNVELERDVYSN